MKIRPAQFNLATVLDKLDKSDLFFITKPHWIYGANEEADAFCIHLDMVGPHRDYTWVKPGLPWYQGPIWRSEINIFTPDYVDNPTLGHFALVNAIGKGSFPISLSDDESILRYDFTKELQLPRTDGVPVVPHIVYFRIKSNEIRDALLEKEGYTITKEASELQQRILTPPKPYHYWWENVELWSRDAFSDLTKG